jgi:hypothetical protein
MTQQSHKQSRRMKQRTTKKARRSQVLQKSVIYEELSSSVDHTHTKSSYGEVFTPFALIEEMCETFPPSLFQHDHMWLDPSAGIGHFPVVVFFRYMEGLAHKIPDPVKRAKHIIERLLYMVEINPDNVRRCKAIFSRLCPSATPQIYQGDFLHDSLPASWPPFHVVIGNPPYNLSGTKRDGQKRVHIPFAERGLSLLTSNGYLGFICPPSYRQADTPMNLLFQQHHGHFVYIHIFGAKETYQLFHIQGRVDLFLYQKGTGKTGRGKNKTQIVDEYQVRSSLSLSLDRHLPNFGYPIFQKLYSLVDQYGHVKGHRTTEMTTVHADTFGCNGRHSLLHLIIEKGRRIYRTRKPHPLLHVPKLFINGLGVPYVYYDKNGIYGTSQTPIVIPRPTKDTVAFLTSSLFVFIAWGLRLTGNNNLPYLLDAVPLTSLDKLHLTVTEQKWIDEHFPVPQTINTDIVIPCTQS